MPATPNYDVCVIGSGAAGGVMAKQLCEAGAKVVLLEAGQEVKHTDLRSHCMPYDMQFRGFRGEKQDPFYPADIRNTIRYHDSDDVSADRIRVLGGRTMHWNAVVLRFAEQDFRERSLSGVEEDWPIGYADVAPDYDRVERTIGVCGQDDKLEILPAGPSYLPPIPMRCSEQILKRSVNPMGLKVIPVRKAADAASRRAPGVALLRPLHGRVRCVGDLLHAGRHASQGVCHGQSDAANQRDRARDSD